MSSSNGQGFTGFSMVLLAAGGIVMLALLVLAPDYAQARLDGSQPVPMQSGLQADYSMDPLNLVFQPVDVKVVEQVIESHTTSTSLPPKQQVATMISALQTPVFTITPTPIQTMPAAASPTRNSPNPTNAASAFTPTGMTGSTVIAQPTPTGATFTETSTSAPELTVSATRPMATITPGPNTTIIPSPIGTTVTPAPKPSVSPKPTLTPTWTPYPATTVVTVQLPTWTFTPTRTNSATYTPTGTYTLTYTPTRTHTTTPTPTRTNTATRIPTHTPTRVSYPPPPTNTAVPTLPPYP